MRNFAAFAALLSCLVVTGCTSAPPLNFSVSGVEPARVKQAAELKSVSVSYASPKEATGDLPTWGEAYPMLWQDALQEALDRSAVFDDDAAEKVGVFVKILELDTPIGGATMTTRTTAVYQVVSRKSGKVLYEKLVRFSGIVPPGYAFMGEVRIKESINRAVQGSIREFIESLSNTRIIK